jgi:hypothetical protein
MFFSKKYITVVLLIANLLIANVGFTMNWLFCACKGTTELSLFQIEEHCATNEQDDCCKKDIKEEPIKPCCAKFQKFLEKNKKHDCTKKGKIYCKADIKLFVSKNIEVKPLTFDCIEPAALPPFFCSFPVFQEKKVYFSFQKAPPPRPYNRALLAWVQSFLC